MATSSPTDPVSGENSGQGQIAIPLVLSLEDAVLTRKDCVLVNEAVLSDVKAQLVLMGGHRGSGKSAILKSIKQFSNGAAVHLKTDTTRVKRPNDHVYILEHNYIISDNFKTRLEKGDYAFAYQHNGFFYGVPRFSIERADESSTLIIPFVNFTAFQYVLRNNVFPESLKILITTEPGMTTEANLQERLDERFSPSTTGNEKEKQMKKVIEDQTRFKTLFSNCNAIYYNDNPNEYLDHRLKTELIAKRMLLLLDIYHGSSTRTEIPFDSLFAKYVTSLVEKLTGRKALPESNQYRAFNLMSRDNFDPSSAVEYARNNSLNLTNFVNHTINRNGTLVKPNGNLQLLYSRSGTNTTPPVYNPKNIHGLDYRLLDYIRLKLMNSTYGDLSILANHGNGIFYGLTDINPYSATGSKKQPYGFYIGFENKVAIEALKHDKTKLR